ncbi:unnamed protein product (macronuclear) [Paramecium tetraurelia]|uniref:MORN repeat protein n=1 Tax=Paramecium tetraurelia TaxID=5888 RepID=A0DVZ1_PARTE|nr:uncharacterized protein GSPATT00020861001 [Paramecium tetraurelia]CAK87208.1 unnamed protein product [Paramecium tetraurelia]|eukprot:XP_001454605.1 hypothetical protein (macronuclear) [Paramecium tetraurelia strain d4-2]
MIPQKLLQKSSQEKIIRDNQIIICRIRQMGNSQQSPKYINKNNHLINILPQKQLIEDTLDESSIFNIADIRSPYTEELNSTARGDIRKVSDMIEMDQGKTRSKIIQTKKGMNVTLYESELPSTCELLNYIPLIKREKTRELLNSYESPSGHKAQALGSQPIVQFLKCNERLTYQGQWLRQQRDGFGLCFYQNGSIYVGTWVNDLRDGHGRMILDNNDNYTGFWKQGKYHGFGTLISSDNFYEGHWEDGEKNGQGLEIKANKSKYEGTFKKGKKHGSGTIKYIDNQIYKGEFVDGQYEGQGEYHWNDGSHYIGEWKCNKMHGIGVFTNKANDVYKGSFSEDKKNGIGMFKWSNGTILKGIWVNGSLDGQATITKPTGESIILYYKNGQKIA